MSNVHIETTEIEVLVVLNTGISYRAIFFLPDFERIADLLNDSRKFLPIQDLEGQVRLVNKTSISYVVPHDKENADRRRNSGRRILD